MTAEAAEDRLRRLLPPGAAAATIALIWATVDVERALAALAEAGPAGGPLAGEPLRDDPLLGAGGRLVRPPDGDPIALLEPTTEGRLAATLVRSGEGPAGRYAESPVGLDLLAARAVETGIGLGPPADGPFGRAVLVQGGPSHGPHLVLVEPPAGTIAR